MFDKILVALDGGEFADGVLGVIQPFFAHGPQLELLTICQDAAGREAAEAHLEAKCAALEAQGVQVSRTVGEGDPAAGILERVESAKPDLVVMASHGRFGPWRWVRGSVAERVLRRCSVPLLIAQPGEAGTPAPEFKRILVPLDGSPRASAVVPLAIDVAKGFGAEIVLFRASNAHHLTLTQFLKPDEDPGPIPTNPKQLEKDLMAASALVTAAGVPVRRETAFGDPAFQILRQAEEGDVDLIAFTTHGRTGLDRWLFGSVAENVLRSWGGPVLVLRNGEG
jgi:nucleotide-binding universal stress UspA family protein